ncbi:hypothetical protein TL16_g00057 [Triparma laevis f. inornata]|uniref:Uncharacterized protein n=2 Tax=Triparma laevis TaxID=1534972 RepID=A0A9W7F933_9STRA|nr:hypothetical protein TL16_g00057 [Triparma laevis f. inornata]GMI07764.1 hypothetical protein TrLO_g11549 [Triparma laevis f. longispina]
MSQVAKLLKKKHTRKGAIRKPKVPVLEPDSASEPEDSDGSSKNEQKKKKIFRGKLALQPKPKALKAVPQAPLDDSYVDDEIISDDDEEEISNSNSNSNSKSKKKKSSRFSFGKKSGMLTSPDVDQGMSSFLKSSATIVKNNRFATTDWRDARVIDY